MYNVMFYTSTLPVFTTWKTDKNISRLPAAV